MLDLSPTDLRRCSSLSRAGGEPLAGTAPGNSVWLLVEHAGPWGRKAITESRLPQGVRERLDGLAGVRVQLIRRHQGETGVGSSVTRVFTVHASPGVAPVVEATQLHDVADLLALDLEGLTDGPLGLAPYAGPLFLVCTNGRRDLCCAEQGRPIAATLAKRWPEATWETTHLGGHRFAGTLLALPTGVVLGRLEPTNAEAACEALAAGARPDPALLRGPIGYDGARQAAIVAVARQTGGLPIGWGAHVEGDSVVVSTGSDSWRVRVTARAITDQRLSCADTDAKPATAYDVIAIGRSAGHPS